MFKTLSAFVLAFMFAGVARADFVEYEGSDERDDWFTASGLTTTIGFSELGNNVFVFEQYAHLGVHFIDGADITRGLACVTYPNDCWGLDGNSFIQLTFDAPIFAIAADFPGALNIDLYLDGNLVYSSGEFSAPGGAGVGGFGGIVGTTPFDAAVLFREAGTSPQVFLDDLHFTTIPAPGAFALLGLGALGIGRRRRRDTS